MKIIYFQKIETEHEVSFHFETQNYNLTIIVKEKKVLESGNIEKYLLPVSLNFQPFSELQLFPVVQFLFFA